MTETKPTQVMDEKKEDESWKRWQGRHCYNSCSLGTDDFRDDWISHLKKSSFKKLSVDELLAKIASYKPTEDKPFTIDVEWVHEASHSRLGYLIRHFFHQPYSSSADMDYQGPELLHKHGLAATCYIRGSPMFARPIFHVFVSDEIGVTKENLLKIFRAHAEMSREFNGL